MSRILFLGIIISLFPCERTNASEALSPLKCSEQKETIHPEVQIEYTLFSGGKSGYRIALDNKASESEIWSAKELQHWLKEISGIELPIAPIDQPFDGPQIILGYNDVIRQKTGAAAPADLDESFRYCNVGEDILIFGGKKRGTMYGVMAFLENEFGCRWYTPTVSSIPKRDNKTFTLIDHSEAPGIRVRNDFYFEAFDSVWAARNRMNGTMSSRQQPGGVEGYWEVHTFYPLVPPSEFFRKHPEYYSLINNKRTFQEAQLCLSNPDVLKIVTERIKKRMRENPEYLIYDVSQNDWGNPCQCSKCQNIVKQEGSESGIVIWFVNQVAEAIEKEFPDKYIGTLAYTYTRKPCKTIHPRKNVVVRLCSIECCFSHDIKSCPRNQSFMEDLQGWSAIAPNMYIWDYVVYFQHYLMPYPNMYVLQPNIQTFRDNNAIGIMEQGAYQSRGGEFSELRSYLISRLLWNPNCDVENAINDFIYGYYGRAGRYIREYFDLLYGRITPGMHMHIDNSIHRQFSAEDSIFSGDFLEKANLIFDHAAKVADNDAILHRVEMASIPILYLKCKLNPESARNDGTYKKFRKIAERENITHYAEWGEEASRESFHQRIENAK
jgi:hypothetical protein